MSHQCLFSISIAKESVELSTCNTNLQGAFDYLISSCRIDVAVLVFQLFLPRINGSVLFNSNIGKFLNKIDVSKLGPSL